MREGEKERGRGYEDKSKVLFEQLGKMELPFTEMEKTVQEANNIGGTGISAFNLGPVRFDVRVPIGHIGLDFRGAVYTVDNNVGMINK